MTFNLKKELYLLLLSTFLSVVAFSQVIEEDSSVSVDDMEYSRYPDMFDLIYKEKVVKYCTAWFEGFSINGENVGTWEIRDDRNKLLEYRMYFDGFDFIEIHLKNRRPISIIRYEFIDEDLRIYQIVEIISFNKRGKLIKRRSLINGDE